MEYEQPVLVAGARTARKVFGESSSSCSILESPCLSVCSFLTKTSSLFISVHIQC